MNGPAGHVTMIGLIGAESVGKSTLALLLTGRLRTHGVRAELAAEAGSKRPFPPEYLDVYPAAHYHMVMSKMVAEAHAVLRPNVDFVICDRTPLDLATYYHTRFPKWPGREALLMMAKVWVEQFDQLYYIPTDGLVYSEDGHRAPTAENDYRERVDRELDCIVDSLRVPVERVDEGDHRARSEYVYQHVLATFFGKSRPLRAYRQVKDWLSSRGWRVVEVRPQGSHSIMRFHPAGDHDDIDAMVVVDGDADYAIKVRADIELSRAHLENIVQADLDLLVTPHGMEAHEA